LADVLSLEGDRTAEVRHGGRTAGGILKTMPSDHAYSCFPMAMPGALLRAAGKLNVPLHRASHGRLFGKIGRAPVLLLTSIGRRSAQPRTAPVLYLADGQRQS
jgi:hypothetical protein